MKKVVVISASWCSTCTPYKKALELGGVAYHVVDADDPDNAEYIQQYGVRGLPTTLIFDGEVHVGTVVGNKVASVKEILGV